MLMFWAAAQMPRRDFFPKEFLRASRGYHLRSQQGFVRNSHFVVIFRRNFWRLRGALRGQFSSRRLSSELAIYTKASDRS